MHGPPEFQVAAQTDGKIAKATFQGTDGQEVGQGLGRMLMPAVTGVDNGNGGPARQLPWARPLSDDAWRRCPHSRR